MWALYALLVIILVITGPFMIDACAARLMPGKQSWVECYRVSRRGPGDCRYEAVHYTKRKRKAFVVEPGILARQNQIEPLMPALDEYDVYALRYAGLRYDREELVRVCGDLLRNLVDRYDEVWLDGISHGGNGALQVMYDLNLWDAERVDLILHDAPNGQGTLKQIPGWVPGRLFCFTAGTMTNIVFGWVPKLFAALGGPKEQNVVTPSVENLYQLTGKQMTPGEYFAYVKNCANRDLAGHKFSMWYSEIGDMIRAGEEGLSFRGAMRAKSATYIAYEGELNEVIRQPSAVNAFKRNVFGLRVISRRGTHCGFLDDNDGNISAIKDALSRK